MSQQPFQPRVPTGPYDAGHSYGTTVRVVPYPKLTAFNAVEYMQRRDRAAAMRGETVRSGGIIPGVPKISDHGTYYRRALDAQIKRRELAHQQGTSSNLL